MDITAPNGIVLRPNHFSSNPFGSLLFLSILFFWLIRKGHNPHKRKNQLIIQLPLKFKRIASLNDRNLARCESSIKTSLKELLVNFSTKICDLRPSIAAKKSSKIRTKRRFQISCLEKVVDPYISRTPTQSSVVMTTKYFVGTRYFALRHKWPLRDIPLWKKKISRDLLDINWSHEDKAIRELVRNLKGITLRNCLTSLLPLFLDLLKENTPLPVKTWKIIFKFWWKAKLFSQIFFVRFVEQRECFFFKKTDWPQKSTCVGYGSIFGYRLFKLPAFLVFVLSLFTSNYITDSSWSVWPLKIIKKALDNLRLH